jgi:hypothetical protein
MLRSPNVVPSSDRFRQQPQLDRPGHSLRAVVGIELVEQMAKVLLHSFWGDHQLVGDCPVRGTGGQEL